MKEITSTHDCATAFEILNRILRGKAGSRVHFNPFSLSVNFRYIHDLYVYNITHFFTLAGRCWPYLTREVPNMIFFDSAVLCSDGPPLQYINPGILAADGFLGRS